jgi:hypothetical protein
MTMRVSLGGLNSRQSRKLRTEIYKAANSGPETMEEYTQLIRLVRQGFNQGKQKACFVQEQDDR